MKHDCVCWRCSGRCCSWPALAPVLAGDSARGARGSGSRSWRWTTTIFSTPAPTTSAWRPVLTRSKSSGTTWPAASWASSSAMRDPDSTKEQVCLANGILHEIHTSSEFATLDFSQFQVIVVLQRG